LGGRNETHPLGGYRPLRGFDIACCSEGRDVQRAGAELRDEMGRTARGLACGHKQTRRASRRNPGLDIAQGAMQSIASAGLAGYSLIGELQKGTIYYRCHNRTCATSVRHDVVECEVWSHLFPPCLSKEEIEEVGRLAQQMDTGLKDIRAKQLRGIALALENIKYRLSRLTDAYLEGSVERLLFQEEKLDLLQERQLLEQQRNSTTNAKPTSRILLDKYLELLKTLSLSYKSANAAERRETVTSITSNIQASGKNVVVELRSPFKEIENAALVQHGGLSRHRPRTKLPRRQNFVPKFFKLLQKHAAAASDASAAA
jgi:hypothetical protein